MGREEPSRPQGLCDELPTKAEAVIGLTSLPVHARRLAVAHVDSGSSEARLHAAAETEAWACSDTPSLRHVRRLVDP